MDYALSLVHAAGRPTGKTLSDDFSPKLWSKYMLVLLRSEGCEPEFVFKTGVDLPSESAMFAAVVRSGTRNNIAFLNCRYSLCANNAAAICRLRSILSSHRYRCAQRTATCALSPE